MANKRRKRSSRRVKGKPAPSERVDAPLPLPTQDVPETREDMRASWIRSRDEIRASSRLAFKWFGISWLCYATPLWVLALARTVIRDEDEPRLVRFVVLTAILVTFMSVLLTMFSAARAYVAKDAIAAEYRDDLNGDDDPNGFMRMRIHKELLRAGDLTGRWTVACLLWAVAYWGTYQALSSLVGRNPIDLTTLKERYVDIALLAGPLIGILWWTANQAYREGNATLDRFETRNRRSMPSPWNSTRRRVLASLLFVMQLATCAGFAWNLSA